MICVPHSQCRTHITHTYYRLTCKDDNGFEEHDFAPGVYTYIYTATTRFLRKSLKPRPQRAHRSNCTLSWNRRRTQQERIASKFQYCTKYSSFFYLFHCATILSLVKFNVLLKVVFEKVTKVGDVARILLIMRRELILFNVLLLLCHHYICAKSIIRYRWARVKLYAEYGVKHCYSIGYIYN